MSPEVQKKVLETIQQSLKSSGEVNVLLVEDDEGDALLTLGILQKHPNVAVEWVQTVEQAQAALRRRSYSLVFLDLKLGGEKTGGLRLLDFMREQVLTVRVIVLTGVHQEDSEECRSALACGAIAVMLKPLTIDHTTLIFGRL